MYHLLIGFYNANKEDKLIDYEDSGYLGSQDTCEAEMTFQCWEEAFMAEKTAQDDCMLESRLLCPHLNSHSYLCMTMDFTTEIKFLLPLVFRKVASSVIKIIYLHAQQVYSATNK